MRTTWLAAGGLSFDLAGQLDSSAALGRDAIELYAEADPFGLEPQTRGMVTLELGQQGDLDAGAAIDGLILAVPAPRLAVWVERGRAWATAAHGNLLDAAEIVAAAGTNAMAGEHFAWAAMCFHDAVRLGHAGLVIDELIALHTSNGAHLIATMQQHGKAVISGDADGLNEVANRFASFGAPLLAAEAWAQTASLYETNDDAVAAARCAALSMWAATLCESPKTPALDQCPSFLSVRELEVARAAVAGQTSPEIADSLYISVRTVDNHLRSVYRKLGASGRDELAALMSPVAGMSSAG